MQVARAMKGEGGVLTYSHGAPRKPLKPLDFRLSPKA